MEGQPHLTAEGNKVYSTEAEFTPSEKIREEAVKALNEQQIKVGAEHFSRPFVKPESDGQIPKVKNPKHPDNVVEFPNSNWSDKKNSNTKAA